VHPSYGLEANMSGTQLFNFEAYLSGDEPSSFSSLFTTSQQPEPMHDSNVHVPSFTSLSEIQTFLELNDVSSTSQVFPDASYQTLRDSYLPAPLSPSPMVVSQSTSSLRDRFEFSSSS